MRTITLVAMASMYKAVVLALVVEKSLEDICAVVVFSFGSIVGPAVGEHPLHVCYEQAFVHIVISLQALRHGFHVHRELHVLIVVRHSLPVHWVKERPRTGVVPVDVLFNWTQIHKYDLWCKSYMFGGCYLHAVRMVFITL